MNECLDPRGNRAVRGLLALLTSGTLVASALAAQTSAQDTTTTAERIVELDPFDVTSVETDRYQASNTISGTAMNTLLRDVPMTINVITSEFLNDAVVGDLERALDFNSSITQANRGEVNNQAALFSLRGFRNRNLLLDGVMGGDFIPRYLVDRIEVVKGPNTLYGQSDPGGLINMISKRPRARNQGSITARYGTFNTVGADFDVNIARLAPGLGVRLLGSYESMDGFRWLEERESAFGAISAEWKPTGTTRVRVLASRNTMEGNPANRSARPFDIVPTDLNGDGTIDNTRVGGVVENTARYNGDFLPWEYSSQTKNSHIDRWGTYYQLNLIQSVGDFVDLSYNFMRAEQETDTVFRAFNTFNAAGNVPALYQATFNGNVDNGHTLNALVRATSGPLKHNLIVGARQTVAKGIPGTFQLRPGNAAERAYLDSLGRPFRNNLTRDEAIAGARIWEDDAPTREEIRAFSFNGYRRTYERVRTYYVSDSVALMDDRLRILAGLRHIEIAGWSVQANGTPAPKRVTKDTSHQVGLNFAVTPNLILYGNQATSFDPNGFDNLSNEYFPSEESDAVEIGFKLDNLWQGRVSGSVSWFMIDKVNVVRSDYNPFEFRSTIEISDDRAEGVDVELFLNLTKGWQTTVGYTHLNARTVRTETEALGMALEGAAPDRLTFFTSYSIERGMLKGLRFGGGAIRAWGPIQQFGTSDSRLIREDGYTQINLFARYTTNLFEKATTFGVNVSNLTDEFFIRARGNSSTPREIVGSVNIRF